jgi:hypothetical protein
MDSGCLGILGGGDHHNLQLLARPTHGANAARPANGAHGARPARLANAAKLAHGAHATRRDMTLGQPRGVKGANQPPKHRTSLATVSCITRIFDKAARVCDHFGIHSRPVGTL